MKQLFVRGKDIVFDHKCTQSTPEPDCCSLKKSIKILTFAPNRKIMYLFYKRLNPETA